MHFPNYKIGFSFTQGCQENSRGCRTAAAYPHGSSVAAASRTQQFRKWEAPGLRFWAPACVLLPWWYYLSCPISVPWRDTYVQCLSKHFVGGIAEANAITTTTGRLLHAAAPAAAAAADADADVALLLLLRVNSEQPLCVLHA